MGGRGRPIALSRNALPGVYPVINAEAARRAARVLAIVDQLTRVLYLTAWTKATPCKGERDDSE